MIRSKAQSWPPPKLIRKFHRRILDFRQLLVREIQIEDKDASYRFSCETVREFYRCLKLFTKEPGTAEWIVKSLHSGEVFYDIGANIGVYSILAASRTGNKGRVYAFEPHGANFARLVNNISVNNLQNVVMPCSFALHDKEGFFHFNYTSSAAATSNSQLSNEPNAAQSEGEVQVSELKFATSIDRLIERHELKAPDHIKIDVDGNEHLILQGMSRLLAGEHRPKSLQIEMDVPHRDQIVSFMGAHNYRLDSKHYTRSKLRRIQEGSNPETIDFNAIFLYEG
jgi:FkbM family methyltransferase